MAKSAEIPLISYDECVRTLVKWIKPGKKKSDPAHFADCAWNLVFRYHGGSLEDAAHDVKTSPKTMQRLVAIAKLPTEIKQLLKSKQIGIDIASEITQIKDLKRQIEIAKIVAGMDIQSARYIIRLAKKHPHISVELFKQRFLGSESKAINMQEIVLLLNEDEFMKLKKESKKLKLEIDELCLKIILKWLNSKSKW